MYVDHRCALMALVHGALLGFPDLERSPSFRGIGLVESVLSLSRPVAFSSSVVAESWLNRDELVRVENAVDGLLDSYSGLDSMSDSLHDPMDQLGYLVGVSGSGKSIAGVLGGEKVRAERC
jgi:hypothetical protein